MLKTCPRCHSAFECRNDHIMECDCITMILTKEDYFYIGSRYSDCLCLTCLCQVQEERKYAAGMTAIHPVT